MAEKLSWSELRRVIATRAGVSEKKAGEFLSELQKQITEALKQDKVVKVNGLGSFKLQAVAPRKSVNVSTGEEIIIDGYNKIAFVPEAGVKELVESNGDTAKAKTPVPEVDPIQKLGAQATEIVDILGELGQSPEKKKPAAKKKPTAAKPKAEPVVEEPKVEPKVEPVVEEPKAENEAPYIPEPLRYPIEPDEEEKKPKRFHFMRDTLICVVVLLLLLLIGYFFLRGQLSGWLEKLTEPKPVQTEQVVEPQPVQEVQETKDVQEISAADIRKYEEFILTEKITPGSRLAWISKKYYGDKAYWPYLYDANKDHLTNPSKINVGTPIRVPKLTDIQRDTTTAAFQALKEEAFSKVKEY